MNRLNFKIILSTFLFLTSAIALSYVVGGCSSQSNSSSSATGSVTLKFQK